MNEKKYETIPIIELREVYESQTVEQLLGMKAISLSVLNEQERRINMINDVLDGYGYEGEL